MSIEELLDYVEPEQGLTSNWQNNLQVVDKRLSEMWDFESTDFNADYIVCEQDILQWENISV